MLREKKYTCLLVHPCTVCCVHAIRSWFAYAPHLVRLGNIGEYGVHHSNEHAVLERVSCILDDRDDVRARLCHVDEVSPGAVGEFHGVNTARRPYDISDMRNSGACCRTQVQHLCYSVGNTGNMSIYGNRYKTYRARTIHCSATCTGSSHRSSHQKKILLHRLFVARGRERRAK